MFKVDMQELIEYITKFIQPNEEELEDILRDIQYTRFVKNEFLIRQGEMTQSLMFILKGVARAYYISEQELEHTSDFIFEGQPVIHIEAFTKNTPSSVNIVAIEDTEIIWVSRDVFFNFLEKHPKYEGVLRDMIMNYMSIEMQHMKLVRMGSSRERYEALLKHRPDIIRRVPLKYIASYLNMALETLSRIRSGKL